ncbi:MAG: DUF4493 domain-containing protein [Alistipes sp.]|nr:DUF4493 domain-containing protein [Alistipes sp.]
MKTFTKFLSLTAILAMVLCSCNKDNPTYVGNDPEGKENMGYLALGGLNASVMVDTENSDSSENVADALATRAVDINTFTVVITDATGAKVAEYLYSELPAEPIALYAGTYTVSLSSGSMTAGAAFEEPIYAAEKEVVITRKQTTTVSDIVCKLANIKVTVAYSADVLEQLDTDYSTMNVALGESALTYEIDETRAGYFEAVAQENTLDLTFTCRYKNSDKDIIMTNKIEKVKAAQWRKINVVIQHASDGTATIGIVCDTWTYDEEVTFDTSASLFEEVLVDDTDLPEIVWEGHNLAETFELTDEMFDADGNFTSSINIDITAKSAIQSIVVKASSDNADFTTAYSEIMPLEADICSGDVSNAILKMMGYPTDAKGATSTRIKFASQADMLKSYEGTHSFEITVTDANGGKSVATLSIQYGQNVAPRIVWVGYNIDERQTYATGMTCDLNVTAPLGIADFKVKIISATLTPEELAGVGLAGEFSLVNDSQYFDSLKNLGFPVGDEVVGKTELQLSITNFLSVLNMLGAGEHDFEMSVTDAEGNTTTKTVMMRFE